MVDGIWKVQLCGPWGSDQAPWLRWKTRGSTAGLLVVVETVKLTSRKLGSFVHTLFRIQFLFEQMHTSTVAYKSI